MTSKTLKTKQNISLTLDKEFIQFCELNEIEDIEKLAKETFKRGFDLLKYGRIPEGELTRQDREKLRSGEVKPLSEGKTKTNVKEYPEEVQQKKGPPPPPVSSPKFKSPGVPRVEPPTVVEARPMKSSNAAEVFREMGVKTPKKDEKKDLYDE